MVLQPKTQKAKNRIRQIKEFDSNWDGTWEVVKEQDTVIFSDKKQWVFIKPKNVDQDKFTRWVNKSDDSDFIIQ